MNIARTPLDWSEIGAIAAIIAIPTSFVISRLSRGRKSITCVTNSSANLFSVHASVRSRIEVTLDKKPVKEVSLARIAVRNTGNEPIDITDFRGNLEFHCGEGAEIISAQIIESTSKGLSPKIEKGNGKVILLPLLLNQGWGFTIEILRANTTEETQISGLIKGVSEIKHIYEDISSYQEESASAFIGRVARTLLRMLAMLVLALLYHFLEKGTDFIPPSRQRTFLDGAVFLIFAILYLYLAWDSLRTMVPFFQDVASKHRSSPTSDRHLD